MPMPTLEIGRIVALKLSEMLSRQAATGQSEGVDVPLLITKVYGTTVNGHAFIDGPKSLWVTEVTHGDGPGQWRWPGGVS